MEPWVKTLVIILAIFVLGPPLVFLLITIVAFIFSGLPNLFSLSKDKKGKQKKQKKQENNISKVVEVEV